MEKALAIYGAYPKKAGKDKAIKAILKALKTQTFEHLLDRTQAFAKARAGKDPQFTKYPQGWFSGGHFDDDPSVWLEGSDSMPQSPGSRKERITKDNAL